MKSQDIKDKSKHILNRLVPASVIQAQLHRKVITQFADKVGLVYFGYVDQRSDEHRLVRGLTLSATHRDNHYCIGTFDGYDIAFVERRDTIRFPGKSARTHNWIIMTFDLHTATDLPHVFLGLHSHNQTFYAHLFTKFSHLTKIPLESYGAYDKAFLSKYALYTSPDQIQHVSQLFNPDLAKPIGDHFGSMTCEIADGCLYLYAEDQRTTNTLLEKMLKYGIWLSQTIDSKMLHQQKLPD
jgi:hypothetical protein